MGAPKNPAADETTLSVEGLWRLFTEHAQTYYRKPSGRSTGEASNLADAFRVVLELCGYLPASSFTVAQLRRCREALIAQKLSRSTINARVNRIRRVFTWAISMELVDPSVLMSLRSLPALRRGRSQAREPLPILPVSWDTVTATLAHLNDPTKGIIETLWWSGMRVSEALVMRPLDLQMKGDVWLYTPQEHKCEHLEHQRVVPLGPHTQAVVSRCLRGIESLLFPDAHTRVFEFPAGRCHTPKTLRQAVQRAAARAGVSRWTPLQLRHAAATRLRAEVGLEAARIVLGHTSPATTEIYAEIDREKARAMMLRYG
jgi:integrase